MCIMYIYIYVHICVCIYIYIYTCIAIKALMNARLQAMRPEAP